MKSFAAAVNALPRELRFKVYKGTETARVKDAQELATVCLETRPEDFDSLKLWWSEPRKTVWATLLMCRDAQMYRLDYQLGFMNDESRDVDVDFDTIEHGFAKWRDGAWTWSTQCTPMSLLTKRPSVVHFIAVTYSPSGDPRAETVRLRRLSKDSAAAFQDEVARCMNSIHVMCMKELETRRGKSIDMIGSRSLRMPRPKNTALHDIPVARNNWWNMGVGRTRYDL